MICKNCGKEVDDKAVICVNCGYSLKPKKPIFKKWWFWVIVVILFFGIIGAAASSGDESTNTGSSSVSSASVISQESKPVVPVEFSGECPIEASASVADNIIGVPELTCNIKNKTDKEIAAVQLYFIPLDVYGKEINSFLTTNKLYTDNTISAKGSVSRSWQMLDQEVKSGNLYIYSVYFTDGSEWGDKDASLSKIKKYGIEITAES